MPTNARRIEPEQVLLGWAAAEVQKTASIKALLSQTVMSGVQEEEDLAVLIGHRHHLLAFFLLNQTEWFSADLTLRELGAARTLACFGSQSRTRILSDLAAVATGFNVPNFSIGAMTGRPVLVATSEVATPCLIDGYNRCCEILRNHAAVAWMPVYLGVCPNLPNWRWYQ